MKTFQGGPNLLHVALLILLLGLCSCHDFTFDEEQIKPRSFLLDDKTSFLPGEMDGNLIFIDDIIFDISRNGEPNSRENASAHTK